MYISHTKPYAEPLLYSHNAMQLCSGRCIPLLKLYDCFDKYRELTLIILLLYWYVVTVYM